MNEGKGKDKKKQRGEGIKGGEEKKTMVVLSSFYNSYFGVSFWPKTTVGGKKVHLAVTI